MAQTVKKPPAVQKIQVPSLGREDLLEKEMATHSAFLLDKSMNREAWRAAAWSTGSQRARHGCVANTHTQLYIYIIIVYIYIFIVYIIIVYIYIYSIYICIYMYIYIVEK